MTEVLHSPFPSQRGFDVFVEIPEGLKLVVFFADDSSMRDFTEGFLLLLRFGVDALAELSAGESAEPAETVDVAQVMYLTSEGVLDWTGTHEQVQLVRCVVTAPDGSHVILDAAGVLRMVSAGMAAMITEQVAYEAEQGDLDLQ